MQMIPRQRADPFRNDKIPFLFRKGDFPYSAAFEEANRCFWQKEYDESIVLRQTGGTPYAYPIHTCRNPRRGVRF